MAYEPSEAERTAAELMAQVREVMGWEFANKLCDAHTATLSEYEDRAVKHHGQWILAAIEGTTWAGAGSRSMADESDSALVQLVDRAKEAS